MGIDGGYWHEGGALVPANGKNMIIANIGLYLWPIISQYGDANAAH